MSFLNILIKKGLIQADDVSRIEETAHRTGETMEEVLVKVGLPESEILSAKGEYLNVPVRDLGDGEVPFTVLKYIPEESAKYYKFVPIGLKNGALEVGVLDPDNIETRDALNFIASKLNMPYKIFLISEADFNKVSEGYSQSSGEIAKALEQFSEDDTSIEVSEEEKDIISGDKQKDMRIIEDAPIVTIVNNILQSGVDGESSDIHIECMHSNVRVRYRSDGILNTTYTFPINVHQAVTARIKVMAKMKLDEKRRPQDGRFSIKTNGRKIDFRVSTFPSYYGEKVVMRILDRDKGVKALADVGMSNEMLEMVKSAIDRPYGLILISGPTGSGKTTTLYSMLNEIDREEQNVLSLEDPIEYNIDGVNQSQVAPEIGYTFATGLRTTLRQDPDVIMVGEIRDKETAQLAVQAALTGHLVLSTIHTNSAVGVIPRLIDMGVDPYLIAPTLIITMAQRLVHNICPGTGKKVPVDGAIKGLIDHQFADLPEEFRKTIPIPDHVLEIEPTAECPTGTKGRAAVFEMFKMDADVEKMILKDPTESGIFNILRKKGMLTMREDAMIKAFKGQIPFEEVNKLTNYFEI